MAGGQISDGILKLPVMTKRKLCLRTGNYHCASSFKKLIVKVGRFIYNVLVIKTKMSGCFICAEGIRRAGMLAFHFMISEIVSGFILYGSARECEKPGECVSHD